MDVLSTKNEGVQRLVLHTVGAMFCSTLTHYLQLPLSFPHLQHSCMCSACKPAMISGKTNRHLAQRQFSYLVHHYEGTTNRTQFVIYQISCLLHLLKTSVNTLCSELQFLSSYKKLVLWLDHSLSFISPISNLEVKIMNL